MGEPVNPPTERQAVVIRLAQIEAALIRMSNEWSALVTERHGLHRKLDPHYGRFSAREAT